MTIVDKSLEEMLAEIGATEPVEEEELPAQDDNGFKYLASVLGPYENMKVNVLHWVAGEVTSNVEKHGGDSYRIRVFAGREMVISIVENGEGFDVNAILEKKRSGQRYYEVGGGGFKVFCEPYLQVSFEQNGRQVNLMHS